MRYHATPKILVCSEYTKKDSAMRLVTSTSMTAIVGGMAGKDRSQLEMP